MFGKRDIAEQLQQIVSRLDRIEAAIAKNEGELRDELARKQSQLEAMSRQSLHVVELLDEARQKIERLESSGS